jgi:hypothetical protein
MYKDFITEFAVMFKTKTVCLSSFIRTSVKTSLDQPFPGQ